MLDPIEQAFKAGFYAAMRVDRATMMEELKCVNGLDLECEMAALHYYEYIHEILPMLDKEAQ